jgi:hypothetical protein
VIIINQADSWLQIEGRKDLLCPEGSGTKIKPNSEEFMARETSVIDVINETLVGVAGYSVRHLAGLYYLCMLL